MLLHIDRCKLFEVKQLIQIEADGYDTNKYNARLGWGDNKILDICLEYSKH